MRSQVQVLAGPPPSPQVRALWAASREGSLPAWAALGPHVHPRRQAHRPCRARPPGPQAPRQPRTVVAHSPGRQPRHRCGNLALQPAPCPQRSRQPRALRTPAWPTWWAAGKCGRHRPHLTRPGPPPTPHRPTCDLGRSTASSRPRPLTEPLDGAAATGTSTRSRGAGCLAAPSGPQRHLRWEETGASGRTGGGHQRAGRRTGDTTRPDAGWVTPHGRTLVGWTPDGRTAGPRTTNPGDRTPDGWTPDGLHTRRLDGRARTTEPDGWTCMLDENRRPTRWLASWHCRPRRGRPTAGWRLEAPPSSRRLGEPLPGAQQQGPLRTAWPRPRPSAAGDTPPSS
jgi:hypothetical protein